jgi:hypothetical protein
MFTPLTAEQRVLIDQLRDVVGSQNDDLFLHTLPDLLETQKIPPVLAKNCYLFAQNAVNDLQHPMVSEALKILNQLIDVEDGTLLPTSSDMFISRHFKWDELGSHKDPQSTITHIINKCVTQLNLAKL